MSWSEFFRMLWSGPATFVLLVGVVSAVPLSRRVARRWAANRLVSFAALVVVVGVVAATLPVSSYEGVRRIGERWSFGAGFSWWGQGWDTVSLFTTDFEGLLNFVLFVPAGAFWVGVTKKPRLVGVGLVVFSSGIETLQAMVVQQRTADPGDLVANATGAVVGVVLGMVWVAVQKHSLAGVVPAVGRRYNERQYVVADAGVLVAVFVGLSLGGVAIERNADRQSETLVQELKTTYADATHEEVSETLKSSSDFNEFISRSSVRGNYLGAVDGTDNFEARFDTGTKAASRCLFITWTPDTTEFRTSTGIPCTEFIE